MLEMVSCRINVSAGPTARSAAIQSVSESDLPVTTSSLQWAQQTYFPSISCCSLTITSRTCLMRCGKPHTIGGRTAIPPTPSETDPCKVGFVVTTRSRELFANKEPQQHNGDAHNATKSGETQERNTIACTLAGANRQRQLSGRDPPCDRSPKHLSTPDRNFVNCRRSRPPLLFPSQNTCRSCGLSPPLQQDDALNEPTSELAVDKLWFASVCLKLFSAVPATLPSCLKEKDANCRQPAGSKCYPCSQQRCCCACTMPPKTVTGEIVKLIQKQFSHMSVSLLTRLSLVISISTSSHFYLCLSLYAKV